MFASTDSKFINTMKCTIKTMIHLATASPVLFSLVSSFRKLSLLLRLDEFGFCDDQVRVCPWIKSEISSGQTKPLFLMKLWLEVLIRDWRTSFFIFDSHRSTQDQIILENVLSDGRCRLGLRAIDHWSSLIQIPWDIMSPNENLTQNEILSFAIQSGKAKTDWAC